MMYTTLLTIVAYGSVAAMPVADSTELTHFDHVKRASSGASGISSGASKTSSGKHQSGDKTSLSQFPDLKFTPCAKHTFLYAKGKPKGLSAGKDPVAVIIQQVKKRIPDLSPILFQQPKKSTGTSSSAHSLEEEEDAPSSVTISNYLELRRKECPGEQISLYGYGVGAHAIHNALNRKGLELSQVLSVVLFSDPLHVSNQPYSRGSAQVGIGGSTGVEGLSLIDAAWVTRTMSVCNQEDTNCAYQGGDTTGTSSEGLNYQEPKWFLEDAVNLVVNKFLDAQR